MPGDQIPSAGDNGGAWAFSKKDAARVARVVKRIEAQLYNRAPQRGRWPVLGGSSPRIQPAKAGGAGIGGGSIGAPSSGTVTLLGLSGAGPGLATTTQTVTAYNLFTGTISANSLVWIVDIFGYWYVIAANC